eukprot:Nitzschia sp. Nitz4//scaffold182_size44100//8539//9426//NITZ4_007248-RA/size44100-processed-gene-0.48-mRNA-1//-1//CDS//3329539547//858//frame0
MCCYDSLYANKDKNTTTNNSIVLERLQRATVLVVGIGGVGSWAAEALCRSGIGTIVLMDLDDICISNTNRQLHATTEAIGKLKTEIMRDRLLSINPECQIQVWNDFCSAENVDHVLTSIPSLSACIDAIDENSAKTALIAACSRHGIPIVTCGGSAGLSDPTAWILEDLTRANGDSLLSKCRKNLRQMYGFAQGASFRTDDGTIRKPPRKWNIRAVLSTEPVGKRSVSSSWRACDGPLGTACFVTGSAGFIAAGEIVSQIAENRFVIPKHFSRGHKNKTNPSHSKKSPDSSNIPP